MAQFISGKELENAVYDIIWNAKKTLLIVSPFIRLDNYFKELFDHHLNNPELHIILVFGKNEIHVSKSLSRIDLDYFKNFLNISIIYAPTLHGKYYANESMGVLTSINLHDYSFKNNIEFGIVSKVSFLGTFVKSADNDAWDFCYELACKNSAVFIRRPVFQKNILSALVGKKYIKSDILYDITDTFFSFAKRNKVTPKYFGDFLDELELGSDSAPRPERNENTLPEFGYCIRSGVKIKFNPKAPFSLPAYKEWALYSNPDYPEKYCHKTGRPSLGKTSMKRPIL